MRLCDQIAEKKEQARAKMDPEVLRTMAAAPVELVQSGIADGALKEGATAPPFALPNAIGEVVTLEGRLAKGPVVLNFYRGGWCPYCNLELAALHEVLPEITAKGGQLIAVSPELSDQSLSVAEKFALEFQVLSDVSNQAARAFGLVFALPEALRPIYAGFGIDLPKFNGDDSFELPMPATYVIDRHGVIRHAFVDADHTKRLEPADVLAALDGLD